MAALNRQKKACAYLARAEVFIDPVTGRSYVGDKPPRLVWDAALKALGTRQATLIMRADGWRQSYVGCAIARAYAHGYGVAALWSMD